MNFLLLETTCDETAAAVVNDRREVLSSVVASQDKLHERFGGVVPEMAARAHVERILPVIHSALEQCNLALESIDVVAVAHTPGLVGSLLVGLSAAKALCVALDKPLVAVDHLHAHVYACKIASGEEIFPCVGLVVSGGHSNLYRCPSAVDFRLLGSTIDDAAGEAFDKVASLLGLPYPGGPSIQRAAAAGNRRAHDFPRAFLGDDERLQFSFSGLKTAVRYAIAGPGGDPAAVQLAAPQVADLAASFQEAVVNVLVDKAFAALRRTGLNTLCVGGGVAANARLRERLEQAAADCGARLLVAPLRLCTDNAVMGAIALERYEAGLVEELTLDVIPGTVRLRP